MANSTLLIKKNYDIFISYRREGGEDKARILNQHLSTLGYNVFFDHEAGIKGEFETEILAAVEIAPIFLMLLTPHSLDRCINEGDWVRREIEKAQSYNKEIIPINPNYEFKFEQNKDNASGPDLSKIESIAKLLKTQTAVIDFHTNFKATANEMVETRIKPIVQPSIVLKETGNIGAKIHFFSDISCRILSYGEQIVVTDADDKTKGTIARFLKGRHMLEYKSIEHEADAYISTLEIPDNDYEDFVQIELLPLKEERQRKEDELKAEEERKAAEVRIEVEKEKKRLAESSGTQYKYDFFFSYSRQDALIVRHTYKLLTDAGYTCWMDMDGIASGAESFVSEIAKAINESSILLFFHSEHSERSEWAVRELNYADQMGKKCIILKADNKPMSGLFLFKYGTRNCIDLNDRNQLNKLLEDFKRWL